MKRFPGVLALALFSFACGGSDEAQKSASLSSDATLASLDVSGGALSPAFSSGVTSYALAVPFGVSSVKVTPVAADSSALSVGVRQDNNALYAVSQQQPGITAQVPSLGTTSTLTIRVTAQDSSHKDYTIKLSQAAKRSSDSSLKTLTVAGGSLLPAFDPAIFAYTLSTPNGTSSISFTAAATDSSVQSVKLKQDGGAFGSNTSFAVPAVGLTSIITLEIVAEDGSKSDYVFHLSQQAPAAPTSFSIFLIGDSTMADYSPTIDPPQAGWGQELRNFLVGNGVAFTYVNAAKNGRSSKSFYTDGSWGGVKSQIKPGDYVVIQFAHNDEKSGGLEGVPHAPFPNDPDPDAIGTAPFGDFTLYLDKYVDETRAAGANPILVTPVVRNYFDGSGNITPKGAHDLTGANVNIPGDLNYVEAMKDVAAAKGAPIVDLTESTKQLVQQYGPTEAKDLLYIADDNTHLQPVGATLFAQLAAQDFISAGVLAQYFNPAGSLIVSPSSLNFGNLFFGQTANQTFSIAGLALAPDSGNVTVTAPTGFLLSTSAQGAFASTLSLPYTGGRLSPTDVVVQFAPQTAQTYSGSVTVTPPAGGPQSVAVTGVGQTPSTGGTETTVVYPLTTDDNCTVTGLAQCSEETYSNLYAKLSNGAYAVLPTSDGTWSPVELTPAVTTIQRLSILVPPPGTADFWPGNENALVPDRYAQFAVGPASGKTWTLDSISAFVGGIGGSNMGWTIEISTDPGFANPVDLKDDNLNVKDQMVHYVFPQTLTLTPGTTLYLRVFGWLHGSAGAVGKYVGLQQLTFHGTAN
jgi:lysophospholipase L1-like esterase